MTIILKKNATLKDIRDAEAKLGVVRNKKKKKEGIAKFYGSLKRGLDGLEYQRQMRGEWD